MSNEQRYLVGIPLEEKTVALLDQLTKSKGIFVDDLLARFCESLADPDGEEDELLRRWFDGLSPDDYCYAGSFVGWESQNGRSGEFFEAVSVGDDSKAMSIYEKYMNDISSRWGNLYKWSYEDCVEEVRRFQESHRSFEVDGITAPAKEEIARRISGNSFSPVG